jgi:hypothetical protein
MTAMVVLSCSRVVRDLLASKGCDMGRSVGLLNSAEGATHPRRSPHSIFISRLKAILGNCQSVMSYVGSLRNEIGDAHDKRGDR